jgi:excisionase family DNA binding protein
VPHLYRLTSEHKIPFSKPGRTLRFNKQEIIEWVDKHRVATDVELLGG